MSSITRSSESLSCCDVDEVAATARGALGGLTLSGLTIGGRFGGCSTAAAFADLPDEAGKAVPADVGEGPGETLLRTWGRGFGSGTPSAGNVGARISACVATAPNSRARDSRSRWWARRARRFAWNDFGFTSTPRAEQTYRTRAR